MNNYVITISRQFGSLGRPIAQRTAELLGIQYCDRDIVEETAKKMGLPVSTISNNEETASKFGRMSFPLGNGEKSNQYEIFKAQKGIILDLAEKESCVIVGRCSDYILRDMKNCLHVFIYAPYHERLKNCVDTLGLEMEDAKRNIERVDKARAAYHKLFANMPVSSIDTKNLMIDSSILGVEGTAEVITTMARLRFTQ